MSNFRLPLNNSFGQFPEPDKNIFEPVTQLPGGGAHIGTVINGRFAGPVFYVPEYLGPRLENVGIFGTVHSGWMNSRFRLSQPKRLSQRIPAAS